MALIKFVRNYSDLSTDNGFQFEFFCDRCGSGYQTRFQSSATSLIGGALGTASNLAGALTGAAGVGERVRSATWGKVRDDAFARAIEEAKPSFKQCGRCGQWVDAVCWNKEQGLCLDCAPDLEAEAAAAQAQAAVEDALETPREVKYVIKSDSHLE